MHDYQRPPTLHSYGMRSDLEQALTAGKFTLLPSGGFLSLSFSREWNKNLFEILSPADCCLVIHNTEEFGERLHRAVVGQRDALDLVAQEPHLRHRPCGLGELAALGLRAGFRVEGRQALQPGEGVEAEL